MKQLIDKGTLVAEIERLKEEEYPCDTFEESTGYYNALDEVSSFLNTLEVKEVDLEKEMEKWIENNQDTAGFYNNVEFAKHFFELGMCNTITEEDCKLIWNIGDEIPNMPEEDFFKELLKCYKAQKGE